MSPFPRDPHPHTGPADDGPREPEAVARPTSDAEDAALVIANLVARSAKGLASLSPSSAASPDATAATPVPSAGPITKRFEHPVPPAADQAVTQRLELNGGPHVEPTVALRLEQSLPPRGAEPDPPRSAHVMRQPSLKVLVAGGAVALLLIAGVFALSHPATSQGKAPAAAIQAASTPAVYTVKVSNVITDCASHSYGLTQRSFANQNCVKATRFLASGHVRGRRVLYVVSKIQMATPDAAASIKEVLDANGTGNLNNLLMEGKTFAGAPATMPNSGYASIQTGAVVVVAEAGFDDGGSSSNTNPALRAAAAQVAALVKPNG
jgi:hypothetical protein